MNHKPPADFTTGAFRQLLTAIRCSGLPVYTVRKYIVDKERVTGIILRHDVERSVQQAIWMARIENSFGIAATYYFRVPRTFKVEAIRLISSFGHEVGYHFETLDKTSGDYTLAAKLFIKELSEFRAKTGLDVKTVCSHGGRPYNHGKKIGYEMNLDIFKRYPGLLKEANLNGEAYLDTDFSSVLYFSDSGAKWRGCKSIYEIISGIDSGTDKTLYILIHPDNWNKSVIELLVRRAARPTLAYLVRTNDAIIRFRNLLRQRND